MRVRLTRGHATMLFIAAIVVVALSIQGFAAPISNILTFHFLDNVSANDFTALGLGYEQGGTYASFGAFTTPGPSGGTTGTAQQGPSPIIPLNGIVFTAVEEFFNSYLLCATSDASCNPIQTAANQGLAGSWNLTFHNAADTAPAITPTLAGALKVPFAQSVTISGSGDSPTFSWAVPNTFVPDDSQILLWDVVQGADLLYSPNLLYFQEIGAGTSFTVPSALHLLPAHRYSLQITLVQRRPSDGGILSQSRSFFDFTLLPAGAPPNVALPTPCAGGTAGYCFHVDVQAGPTTYLDPAIAIGYDYQTGPGDPNFASVLLPTGIGNNLYKLWLWDGHDWEKTGHVLAGGVPHSFGRRGVDRFRITGIERSAQVDATSPTAFITGVTFTRNGQFTGRMTPISPTPGGRNHDDDDHDH